MRPLYVQGILLFVLMVPTLLSPCTACPSPATTACVFRLVGRHSLRTATSFVLEIDVLADADNTRSFCRHMEARSSVSTPPPGVDGTLYVGFITCGEQLAQATNETPVGGRSGPSRTSQTSATTTPCGRAYANFVSSRPYQDHGRLSLFVQTDLVYGEDVSSHTNVR